MEWIKFSDRHPKLPAEEIVTRDFEGGKSLLNIYYDSIEEVSATQYEWLDETASPIPEASGEWVRVAKRYREALENISKCSEKDYGTTDEMLAMAMGLSEIDNISQIALEAPPPSPPQVTKVK